MKIRILNCLLSVALLLPGIVAPGQTRTYSGTVTDENGAPLAGAGVLVKGTSTGTGTDLDGNWSLQAAEGSVLVFSFIGYDSLEVPVADKTRIDVSLTPDTLLEETVIIAYGTLEKKQITSSITSLKAEDLTAGLGGATIATALVGKIPGLTISGNNSPNSSNGFQLRGIASVNASQGPLVVIDGVPGGDFRALDTEDIASIDVLKDASAGAIYGTRAAGGVILITTKAAREGSVKVTYTGEASTEIIRSRPEMLSASEYLEYGLGPDYGADTDWYGALLNPGAVSTKHHVSVSGGSKAAQVYASLLYQDQKGVVIGDARTDWAGRINANFSALDGRLELRANAEYRQADRDSRISSGTFNEALMLNPSIPVHDYDNPGAYNVIGVGFGGSDYNPVADIELQSRNARDTWLIADVLAKLHITEGLALQATAGVDKRAMYRWDYVSAAHKSSIDNARKGDAYQYYNHSDRLNTEVYASYDRTFADHKLNVVAGTSFWEYNGEGFSAENYDFTVDGVGPWDMGSGTWLAAGKAEMGSSKEPRERLLSFFGRANWSYLNRYMVQATFRREASSKFGPDNRWGNFWSLSGGVRLTTFDFLRRAGWINDLKLRVGYGVTGNNGFGTGYTVRQYKSYQTWPGPDGSYIPTYGPAQNINPDLKWEEKKELNAGLDYAFLENRIYGKLDLYWRQVDNLLYTVNVPQPPYVYGTMMKNIGTLQNRGFEFELGGVPVRTRDFSWTVASRFFNNRSVIRNLGDDFVLKEQSFPSPGSPGYGVYLTNGSTIGQFWVYKYAGISEDGKWLIYDKDGDIVLARDGNVSNLVEENKYLVGNAIPRLIVSLDNTFRYKGFDLSVYLRSWIDFDVFSQMNMYYGLKKADGYNSLRTAYTRNKDIDDEKILSDYFIEDGTFLKIDAVTAGYSFRFRNFPVQKLRIYATARDVATFTRYTGIDPEVNINGLYPGFEYIRSTATMYPKTCRATLGVQLTF